MRLALDCRNQMAVQASRSTASPRPVAGDVTGVWIVAE